MWLLDFVARADAEAVRVRERGGDREGVEEREADPEALADALADDVGVAVVVG